MRTAAPRSLAIAVVVLVSSATAPTLLAQSRPWVAGAIHYDEQRFPDEDPPARLDGSAVGLTILAGAAVWHVPLRVEWSQGTIEDRRELSVELADSTLAIWSTLAHRTRTLGLLTGFTHSIATRVHLSYLVGAAFSRVRRTFRTNAARVVLISPSTSSATGTAVASDAFSGVTGGADVSVRLARHLSVTAGARLQQLRLLDKELEGASVRSFVGVGWVF